MPTKRPVKESVSKLLARVAALGLNDQMVHQAAGLAAGSLSQLRAGRTGPHAEAVKKLERWLDRIKPLPAAPTVLEVAQVEDLHAELAALRGELAQEIYSGKERWTWFKALVVDLQIAGVILRDWLGDEGSDAGEPYTPSPSLFPLESEDANRRPGRRGSGAIAKRKTSTEGEAS